MLACCDIKTHDDLDNCVVEDDDEGQDETTDMKVWCQIPAGCCLVPPPALAGGSFSPQKTQTPDHLEIILSAPTNNVILIELNMKIMSSYLHLLVSPGLPYSQDRGRGVEHLTHLVEIISIKILLTWFLDSPNNILILFKGAKNMPPRKLSTEV